MPVQSSSQYSGFDLHGQNIVVENSSGTTTFRNNGFVADTVGGGEILDNSGGLVLGSGFFGVSIVTSGTGVFRAGNSPGVDFVGPLVFGAGGITNLQFDIDDATGTAGPSPDSEGHVDGWSLITSDSPTWTADATHPLTVSLQSLTTATTAGNDVAGDAANFDPTQSYSWAALTWTGNYTGPTDDADLNAATVFDTSAFTNSFSGTFGWHLDTASKTLYLTYTPA